MPVYSRGLVFRAKKRERERVRERVRERERERERESGWLAGPRGHRVADTELVLDVKTSSRCNARNGLFYHAVVAESDVTLCR